MKKTIHPRYHPIVVVMTDGETFTTRSSYGKSGERLKLTVDPKTHSAWTKKRQSLIDRGGRLTRFQKRYEGLASFSSTTEKTTKEPSIPLASASASLSKKLATPSKKPVKKVKKA